MFFLVSKIGSELYRLWSQMDYDRYIYEYLYRSSTSDVPYSLNIPKFVDTDTNIDYLVFR